jgi:hypothetical protein
VLLLPHPVRLETGKRLAPMPRWSWQSRQFWSKNLGQAARLPQAGVWRCQTPA